MFWRKHFSLNVCCFCSWNSTILLDCPWLQLILDFQEQSLNVIKKTAWLGCHHFYCCLEPSFPVILVFSPPPSLLRFCDWNRHHEERQVEDAVLCVLLIVAVGNRPLIGCFLTESPLCCACDTTCVTSGVFFQTAAQSAYFCRSEILDLSVKAALINQTRTTACHDCLEAVWFCSQLSKQEKHETKTQAYYQRWVADESLLNNLHSRPSCFYSRRLRPQTPQRSDDEGGKSTITVPQICFSLQAEKGLLGSFILCK